MKKLLLTILMMTEISVARGESEFENLWKGIEANSLALKASKESLLAADKSLTISKRHWLPTVYLSTQSYLTNDAGANMFGLLSQRSIEQSDFMPEKLNRPGTNLFTKGALGVNFSLYEGGMKTSMTDVYYHQLQSKHSEANATFVQLYSEVAKNYFTIKALDNYQSELITIKKTVDSILGKYQLGNKSNLLGYSGLLGLKSLNNRIKSLSDENLTKKNAYLSALEELNNKSLEGNLAKKINFQEEIDRTLPTTSDYQKSDTIVKLEENALSAEAAIGAEKSRNLPRIGVFAESNAFLGKRESANGFSTGVYLNWNLFSGSDYEAAAVATSQSHAASFYAQAMSQKEKIEFGSLTEMEKTLESTLVTLKESQKLLDEQTSVANSLFKNGMINALQLTEVLSRRVDLLKSKNDVETNLIQTKVRRYEFNAKK